MGSSSLKLPGLAWLAVLTLLAAEPAGAGSPDVSAVLSEQPVVRSKPARVLSSRLEALPAGRPEARVKVWVFFADKGVFDRSGFDRAASSILLTDRSRKRRAKIEKDRVLFVDLPVRTAYVEAIARLGADHRRSSRWLNAATFELKAGLLEAVSQLPFVTEIRPMAVFRRTPEPEVESRRPRPRPSLAEPRALDYGESIYQLNQINVPAVHDLGYSGQGVTLAILDTGHRKSHNAFALHFAENRIIAEYDFVYDDGNTGIEEGDLGTDHSHGTRVWSVAAGYDDGNMYGPAYKADFILCRTEDLRSETPAEEDNWVAALEFSEAAGADVIATSLGYMTFEEPFEDYTYEDLDGQTAIISIAASTCDGLGIVMCNSAGNSGGLGEGSITPPADAFDILAVGSVDGWGTIAGSSSRGPTYDGRIKPEVCARGVATLAAHPTVDNVYAEYSGTSFACPLVAGAACLLIEAHPEWNPYHVREALKASGSNADSPDNTYGWGVIDTYAALQLEPGCCTGIVGNVDELDGDEPTLADILLLIDYLYISTLPLECLPEADVNQSGGTSPTDRDITIGDIARLIDHLYITYPALPDCY